MTTVVQQVQQLNAAKALEAAKIVAGSIADEPFMTEDEFENEFGDPLTHINDIDHFARLLLINAAEQPQYADLVQAAIANSGKKQLILSGTEIVALGVLGIAALKIIFNPPASEKIKYTNKEGVKVEIEKVYNNDTSFITKIFAKIFTK